MGEIALSNTINISLADTPRGLGDFATNTICLFTNETPLSAEPYIWAINSKDIINEYGSDSLTAKMGTALFTPVPNLRTGKGQVLIVPYQSTNATSSKITTVEITSTKIEAFKLVTDGNLKITIDGTAYEVHGLNFASISNVEDIVKVLKAQNLDCDIIATEDDKIEFKSRRFGATDSTISLSASTGAGTDIYGEDYLDGADAVSVSGVNATGTKLKDAVLSAEEIGYFGGILTTQICENDLIVENATSIQALDHIYFEATKSLKNIADLGTELKSANLNKTRLNAYSGDNFKVEIATYSTIACSTNYSGTNTALTMNLKELTGVTPDLNLNQTYYNSAKANGVDIYGSTCGLSCVYSFSNGKYTDEATMDLWLKKALEVSIFNALRKTNTKIPQTESGMITIKNACIQVLEQGVRNGCIGVGLKWNDSIPFGEPETFQENIAKLGYYVYSIPIAEQSQTEREDRQAPLIQIAIKRAGSIHSSDVIINIQR